MLYRVVLTYIEYENKIMTIKAVRELTGCGLAEAKNIVESVPQVVVNGVNMQDAQKACDILKSLGNGVTFEPDSETNYAYNQGYYADYEAVGKAYKKRLIGIIAAFAVVLFIIGGYYLFGEIIKSIPEILPSKDSVSDLIDEQTDQNMENVVDKKEIQSSIKDSIVWNIFAREAFGKNVLELTEDDLSKVTYIDYNTDKFEFKLTGGLESEFSAPEEDVDLNVFNLFPNLEHLDSSYIVYGRDSYLYIENLRHLGLISSDVAEKIACADKITSIRAKYALFDSVDLKSFPALEAVDLKMSFKSDMVKDLASLTHLKSLKLEYDNAIFYVEDVQKLTSLESLYIKCKGIKNIQFIDYLPKLTSFGIEDTAVVDLDPIKKKKSQLKELYLIENYSANGYQFIEDMTGLNKLALVGNYTNSGGCPSLKKLTQLEELTLGKTSDVSSLFELKNLKKLTIYHSLDNTLDFLLNMPELTELHIHSCSLYSHEIFTIAKCKKLEKLCLEYTFVWDDISSVLNMPSLKSLDMTYTSYGLMPDRVKENTALEYWNLKSSKLYSLDAQGNWYYSNHIMELSNVTSVFTQFKGLKNLYVPGCKLQDVKFLANCKKLQYLDISGNNMADLTPIKDLPLLYINCDGCQISEYAGFEGVVGK